MLIDLELAVILERIDVYLQRTVEVVTLYESNVSNEYCKLELSKNKKKCKERVLEIMAQPYRRMCTPAKLGNNLVSFFGRPRQFALDKTCGNHKMTMFLPQPSERGL